MNSINDTGLWIAMQYLKKLKQDTLHILKNKILINKEDNNSEDNNSKFKR